MALSGYKRPIVYHNGIGTVNAIQRLNSVLVSRTNAREKRLDKSPWFMYNHTPFLHKKLYLLSVSTHKRFKDGEFDLANIKSQLKRNRQNEKRRTQNRVFRGSARRAVAKARQAITAEGVEAARTLTMEAVSQLDHAAEKGVLHKNNAARRKSRLMKALAALEKAKA